MTPSHKEVLWVSNTSPPQKRHPGVTVFKRDYCYLLGTCRLSKYIHVGKCAGSIPLSTALPITSAKAGPSSPQNDSDWPCDDSNKRQITENTGQRRNDTLSAVAVWLTELIPPTRSQYFLRSAAPTQKCLLELLWGGRSRPPDQNFGHHWGGRPRPVGGQPLGKSNTALAPTEMYLQHQQYYWMSIAFIEIGKCVLRLTNANVCHCPAQRKLEQSINATNQNILIELVIVLF